MIEILPIRSITDEDATFFGPLSVALAKLARSGLPVGTGIVVTPPQIKLRSVLEHFDFGTKEVFKQSLVLVKKEINSIPVPKLLLTEAGKHKEFFLNGAKIKSVKNLWLALLKIWLDQIEQRLWNSGFYPGITEDLDPQILIFTSGIKGFGTAHFDPLADDVMVLVEEGKLHPNDIKKVAGIVKVANQKLFLPFKYRWILDEGVKLAGLKPYTPPDIMPESDLRPGTGPQETGIGREEKRKSAVKVFFDLSGGLTIEKEVDGIYIASEKIYDLNKPDDSFDNLIFRIIESAVAFPRSPVFVKLADKPEGAGKIRGALRLIHQKSLFDPLVEALDFARHKKGLTNVQVVIPFLRNVSELLQIKRELASKKLVRKNSLQIWAELAVPENIINIEKYLDAGIDGVVLNLDELVANLNGFDPVDGEMAFYKKETDGLIKFLDNGIKIMHKSKINFIAYGGLTYDSRMLEFLVEKGVWGVVAERYEAHSVRDLLYQVERRIILRRSAR